MTSNAEAVDLAERADPRDEAKVVAPVSSNDPSLWLRVASAVVFLPLLVLMARVGGLLYLGFTLLFIGLALRELPWSLNVPYAQGMSFALLPFFLAWTCDTAAYTVGRAWGRHRLAPGVSPGKSVEGAVAGLLASVTAGAVARVWFAPYLSWGAALALGALVGVFAQLGDLVESLLKRDAETKESSSLIPGHGGVLDRFDSLLFAAPLVYYFLLWEVFRR